MTDIARHGKSSNTRRAWSPGRSFLSPRACLDTVSDKCRTLYQGLLVEHRYLTSDGKEAEREAWRIKWPSTLASGMRRRRGQTASISPTASFYEITHKMLAIFPRELNCSKPFTKKVQVLAARTAIDCLRARTITICTAPLFAYPSIQFLLPCHYHLISRPNRSL